MPLARAAPRIERSWRMVSINSRSNAVSRPPLLNRMASSISGSSFMRVRSRCVARTITSLRSLSRRRLLAPDQRHALDLRKDVLARLQIELLPGAFGHARQQSGAGAVRAETEQGGDPVIGLAANAENPLRQHIDDGASAGPLARQADIAGLDAQAPVVADTEGLGWHEEFSACHGERGHAVDGV